MYTKNVLLRVFALHIHLIFLNPVIPFNLNRSLVESRRHFLQRWRWNKTACADDTSGLQKIEVRFLVQD